jgi:beta-lactamase class A
MLPRRTLLAAPLLAAPVARAAEVGEALAALEARHGGRLGVAVLDSGSGRRLMHRGGERFALTSTFKFLAAAHVLARVDRGEERLDRRVAYAKEDLVPYSPVTGQHAELTIGALCDAAVTLSDNTAGNLLLDSFGGPAGLTAWLRGLGDGVTRLDRRETALNEARPGDPRDTTTPEAMLGLMQALLLGPVLSADGRARLTAWLVANKTGDKRLRAGVPEGWRVGDKTGSGENNVANDIAILWPPLPPPGRAPILVAAYYAESRATEPERNAVLAEVGRIAAAA